jgi:hypothetical protein
VTTADERPARWMDYLPLDELIGAERNPKHHHDDIAKSLRRFGYVEAIALDERTGRLVAGHGRVDDLRAKHTLGEPPPEGVEIDADGRWVVPVQRGWASMDDGEADAYLIASNATSIAGGWNQAELDELTEALAAIDVDLSGLGLLDPSLIHVEAHDRQPAEPREPADVQQRVALGDVWQLGAHRLMCGDCRNPDDVKMLLDGAAVNVAFTSPPYADRRKYDEASDFRPVPPPGYVEWFAPVAANVADHLAEDGSWFVNIKAGAEGLDTELYVLDLVIAHVREWGWHFATELCWERSGVPKRPALRFKNQFEPIYQFTRGRWKIRPANVRHASDHSIRPIGSGAGNPAWDGTGDGAGQGRGAFFKPEQLANKRKSNAERQGATDDKWFDGQYEDGWAYPGNRLPTFAGSHEATGHSAAYPVGLPA